MDAAVSFVLRCYNSPSGWFVSWETTGTREEIPSPNRYERGVDPCDWYIRVTVKPGDFLFTDRYENDPFPWEKYLIQVPEDPAIFARFRSLIPEWRAPNFDSEGHWLLREFVVRSWLNRDDGSDDRHEEAPQGIAEAIEKFRASQQSR